MRKRPLSFYTLFFIFCMGLMRLSGFLSKVVLSHVINPDEYGVIVLVTISLPTLFQIFTNLFFFDILSHSNEGRKYFGFSMLYSTIVSISIGLLVLLFHREFFGFLNIPTDNWVLLFIVLIMVLFPTSLMVNIMGITRGYKKYSLTSLLTTLPSILRFSLILLAVFILGLNSFNEILLFFAAPSLLVCFSIFIKEWKRISTRLRKIEFPPRDIFFFGLSIFILNIFITLNQTITNILVSHNLGVEMQAYFDVSYSLVTIMVLSFGALQFIAIPEATSNKNKRELLFKDGELGDIARALFSFLIFCVLTLFLYAQPIVGLIFPARYSTGADYVHILAIGYIFLFAQQFLAYVNISLSNNLKEYRKLFLTIIILIILLPLGIHYMIQTYGFIGAYISTTSFMIIYSLLTIYHSKDRSPLKALTFRSGRLLLASILTFVVFSHLALPIFPGIPLLAMVYAVLVISVGYLKKSLIKGVFRRYS